MRRIRVLHLEPTDVCQAACPQCARETNTDFNKRDAGRHLRPEHIERLYSSNVLKKLDKVFMCGNYGDPAAGKYTLDLYRFFRQHNANVTLGMNTNGGLQTTFWWYGLAEILNQPQDYCVFSIDGLEDSNATYRKNVNWAKLMANAESFISAGGNAHWDMLVYRHNQHQVDACQQLAQDMGFKWFRAKISKRPMTAGLEYPVAWQLPNRTVGSIRCHAIGEKSEYVDARGRRIPCCWLGSSVVDPVTDIDLVKSTWKTNQPHTTCQQNCTTILNRSIFEDQWQREVQLC